MNHVTVILKDTSVALNVRQIVGNNFTIPYNDVTWRARNNLQSSQLMVFLLREPSVQQQVLYKEQLYLQYRMFQGSLILLKKQRWSKSFRNFSVNSR